MTDHYTALPCAVSVACFLFLPPSVSLSLSFFLPPSLYLSQPQSRRTLAPAPAPMILHMMQSSLHDGTLSMHAFLLLLLLLLLLLFLLMLGHFDWMFLPLPLSRLAPLRCVSFLLVWFRLSSPRLSPPVLLVCIAWLGYDYLWFSSLLYFLFPSIVFYSAVFLFRQRHRLPHRVLQRLSTTHLLTDRQT